MPKRAGHLRHSSPVRGASPAYRSAHRLLARTRDRSSHFRFGLLRRSCEAKKIRWMPGDVLLSCAECGCASDGHAGGWAAFTGDDPDGLEPTSVVIMCPACAAIEFEWRPDAADG